MRGLGLIILGSFAISSGFLGGVAEAQLTNLRGGIDLNYNMTASDSSSSETDSWSFVQRYSVGSYGNLWDPRMGSYDADVAFQDDRGNTDGTRSRDQDIQDYRFSLNLLPRRTPLNFFAQRITRDDDLDPGSRNRLDTLSLAWDLPLRRLPSLRFNLFQTESETTPSAIGTVRTRTASMDLSEQIRQTSLSSRYQYSEQQTAVTDRTRTHTVNMNSESRINPSTTLNLRGNYSNRAATLGVVNPGISTFQQRTAGATLIHKPGRDLTNRLTYDFVKDPFERHTFRGNTNYRMTEKLDLSGSYSYFRFDLDSAFTQTHTLNTGLNYRPILGLSSGLNFSYNATDINAQTDSGVSSESYNMFVNYNKTLERIGFNTGYNSSVFRTDSDPGGRSFDAINTVSLRVNNARPVYASWNGAYSFSNVYRDEGSAGDRGLNEHNFSAGAQSSYLRSLLLRGDLLSASASASYILYDVDTGGRDTAVQVNETVTYDTTRGAVLSTGHNYENIGASVNERNVVFVQLQVVRSLLRNLHLTASARESFQLYVDRAEDIEKFEGRTNLVYQLGRVNLSADYSFTHESQEFTNFRSHAFFVRASRPLF